MPRRENELDLITRAQHGDRQAFAGLVHRYREGVVNVVYRMCGDANLAEDAAQEAFIRAWQRLHSYRPKSAFRNWIYRITTNAALDVLRRERETVDVAALPLVHPGKGPEAEVVATELGERVRQAVLVLRGYEGLSYQQIADTLGIPIGTVMSRLSYARKRMRESLAVDLEVL